MLLRNIGYTPADATASGGECFVAANMLRRNLGRPRFVSPRRPLVAAYSYSVMVMAGACRRILIGEAMPIPSFAHMNSHQPSVLYQSSSGYPR